RTEGRAVHAVRSGGAAPTGRGGGSGGGEGEGGLACAGACFAGCSQRGRCSYGGGEKGRAGVGISVGAPAPGANGGRQPAPGSGSLLIDAAHGGGVEATVHIQDLAGDAGGQVGAEEGTGVADFLDGDVAAQRGAGFVVG